MKYTLTITDEDIRSGIETAVRDLLEENQVHFPDGTAQSDFINDCVDGIISKLELYGFFFPNYTTEVFDTARLYGCEV